MASTLMPRLSAALLRNDSYACWAAASNRASSSGVNALFSASSWAYLPLRDGWWRREGARGVMRRAGDRGWEDAQQCEAAGYLPVQTTVKRRRGGDTKPNACGRGQGADAQYPATPKHRSVQPGTAVAHNNRLQRTQSPHFRRASPPPPATPTHRHTHPPTPTHLLSTSLP